ncbi:hypothetical protein KIH74_32180 [Kineosporia sp. J2-2]|uniref:Uncharacterized protein n=1 Tax=Kineosporia corallincola TaxID=2835133 RepID=A0ABS5TS58_9ACTN|nr:hypothetical protein [Kineosporia corallincola]MBT0773647.1 hypothetical protein [Kineosporia corallincola]
MLRGIAEHLGIQRPEGAARPSIFIMSYPVGGKTGTYDDLNAEKHFTGMDVPMNTVAGNEMLVLDAARRYPGIDTFGLNPGFVKCDIRGNLLGAGSLKHRATEGLLELFTPSADDYARRIVPRLASPDITGRRGAMFSNKGRAIQPTGRSSTIPGIALNLWSRSARL